MDRSKVKKRKNAMIKKNIDDLVKKFISYKTNKLTSRQ